MSSGYYLPGFRTFPLMVALMVAPSGPPTEPPISRLRAYSYSTYLVQSFGEYSPARQLRRVWKGTGAGGAASAASTVRRLRRWRCHMLYAALHACECCFIPATIPAAYSCVPLSAVNATLPLQGHTAPVAEQCNHAAWAVQALSNYEM